MKLLIGLCTAWYGLNLAPVSAEQKNRQVESVTLQPSSETGVLTEAQLESIDISIENALLWLADQQQGDGSFPTLPQGQPGVTSLCLMAFASSGHAPGVGPYGDKLRQAHRFVVNCQKANGLLANIAPRGKQISRDISHEIGSAAVYNHAISALMLCELFSMDEGDLQETQLVIENALQATTVMQRWPKRFDADRGGWRYLNQLPPNATSFGDYRDADLSVVGWQLMFMRSAKNAGFEVPEKSIQDAVAYVQRCYHTEHKTFTMLASKMDRLSRGMAGAGILAMAHAGKHNSPEARNSGDWLLKEGFSRYNESREYGNLHGWRNDRYHYGVFLASRGMYQLGGNYWRKFFPPVAEVILKNQSSKGHWATDTHVIDRAFGRTYATALMVLTLSTPNQLLPIFQR